MAEQLKGTIKGVLDAIVAQEEHENLSMSQADLEQRWHFEWDITASLGWNAYKFHKMLNLYGSSCRRWEETHNGSCCVVERVRDTYLMPKIDAFLERTKDWLADTDTNAPWLTAAHALCSDYGIPHGHISARLDGHIPGRLGGLRGRLAEAEARNLIAARDALARSEFVAIDKQLKKIAAERVYNVMRRADALAAELERVKVDRDAERARAEEAEAELDAIEQWLGVSEQPLIPKPAAGGGA